MNHFTLLFRIFMRSFFILLLGLIMTPALQAAVINHNISTGSLVIQGTSTDNYIVTGTTTANRIVVGAGYSGTVTLRNVSITSSGTANFTAACGNGTNVVTTGSCMAIMGKNRASATASAPNLAPVTHVNLVLEGNNQLIYTSENEYCAIQVDEGAQIEIRAIDPNDNNSGKLIAKSTLIVPGSGPISNSGAGIGSVGTSAYNGYQGFSVITGGCSSTANTTGGNIIISSGTITAWGGHAAGIGGAHYDYYNGIIIVYGGVVEARANFDAAGIGSGCPLGTGVLSCYADNSTIIALPPAQITAFGAGQNAAGGVGTAQFATLGLTGAKNITYINDPNKPIITVRTDDYEPNANIYLDLTETPGLVNIFSTLGIDYDLTKVKVGKTDLSGLMSFHARFEQNTTFFTDASSSNASHLGRPYLPVKRTVLTAETIVLPLLDTDISFTDYPSSPLEVGYSAAQAKQNAHRIKVKYNDPDPMSAVTFTLQGGVDFSTLIFLAADSSTVIPAPTTMNAGDVFYIILPLNQGKPQGIYSDVLLIGGNWRSSPLPGYIRRIGQQRVTYNDTPTNTYIKVTASPNKFSVSYPSTDIATLTLNITHSGMAVPYDASDVTAKYLVTTEPNYAAALAATPLSSWSSLNIPAGDNVNTNTTVSFSGKPQGTYYIHWYVVSGVISARSRDVTNPPSLYGGFGPYVIFNAVLPGTISGSLFACSGQTITLTGTASTGGSGTFTYQWQSSANGITWTDLTGSTGVNCTTPALTSTTYFRRQTIDSATPYTSNVIMVTISPTEMYWKSSATNNNWNDPLNWVSSTGVVLNAVPTSCTNVYIPGNATNYPSLDATSSPRASYGDPSCNEIHYSFGAEVAQPHLLTYAKAYVQYNFGYYDSGNTYRNGDSRSSTPMGRGQWYALSAPLKKIASGDFSVGGYPNIWQRPFERTSSVIGGFAGSWATTDRTNALDLNESQAYSISVWAGEYLSGVVGEGDGYHANLNALNGVLEMPYFENAAVSLLHRDHAYSGGQSSFKYYYYNRDNCPFVREDSIAPGTITRGSEAYKFIFDGNLQSMSIGGQTQPVFKVTVPAGKEIMIGNPFVSNLDFRKFYELNPGKLDSYYRLYTGGSFQTYDYTSGSNTLTGYVAPLQAFFISTLGSGSVDLYFPPAQVSVTVPTNKLRSSTAGGFEDVLYVSALNEKGTSSVTVSLDPYSSEKNVYTLFTKEETAEGGLWYPELPQIYAQDALGGKNSVQFTGGYNVTVPLGLWFNHSGLVDLQFSNIDKVHASSLVLVDKLLGKSVDLLRTGSYQFNNEAHEGGQNRFELQVGVSKSPTSIDDLGGASKVMIYAAGKTLYVRSNEGLSEVRVVNAQGQQIGLATGLGSSEYAKELMVSPGVYIVTVKTKSGNTETGKVVIK